MNKLIPLYTHFSNPEELIHQLRRLFVEKAWVQLLAPKSQTELIPEQFLPEGPGLVLASGGSTGDPKLCMQPLSHLNQSAEATGHWLSNQGIDPSNCILFNPLPFHHVSGFMMWWRSVQWESEHIYLNPQLMRDPLALERSMRSLMKVKTKTLLISLVPTQLQRLIFHPAGIKWLKQFSLIWVGGAAIPQELAVKARSEGLRLAPCYGSTETAAMVAVLDPEEFLDGQLNCGSPLLDVDLRIAIDGALEVRTSRLALAYWTSREMRKLCNEEGWWRSGDFAELFNKGCRTKLQIFGRLDDAINSGGETVFPESLGRRFVNAFHSKEVSIKNIFFMPVEDIEWGQRLVALISFKEEISNNDIIQIKAYISREMCNWLPSERPVNWYICPELSLNQTGKWDRKKWLSWIEDNSAAALF